jgi:hypothetical protein
LIGNGTELDDTVDVDPELELPEPPEVPDVELVLVLDPGAPEEVELPPELEPAELGDLLQAPSSSPAAAQPAITAPARWAAECANGFMLPTSICGFVLW